LSSDHKDKVFDVDHLKGSLKDRAIKGASVTVFAQAVQLALQLGSIAILARLLDPTDFGIVAMVTVFTGLALQLMEGGLSMATIQRDRITDAQVSNLFWINSALGMGLCLLGILISPLVAELYDEPRLTLVTAALSLTFLIGGLSVQHDALLRRQMRFRAISMINIASMAAGIVAGIGAALAGLAYWSLVMSLIVTFSTKTILRWLTAGWTPSWISSGSGVRPLLGFGANLTGANFIAYVATNITPFAVGYVGGAQALGFFNRAQTLTSIPSTQLLPPVMTVMQSVLTRVQDDPEKLRRTALALMTKIAMVTMLMTAAMFVTADWLVAVFLGSGWGATVDIFRILAIAAIVTPITKFTAIIMISVGQAHALMKWKAITLGILALSILVGSWWGVMGVIWAHCLSGLLIRMPGFLYYSTRYQPIRTAEYLRSLLPVFICTALTIICVMAIRAHYSSSSNLVSIIIYTLLTTAIYGVLLGCFRITRHELKDSFALLKSVLDRRSAP